MLRACEIEALSLGLAKASNGKLALKREAVQSYERDGGEDSFYLTVNLLAPIDIKALATRRFHSEFYITDAFHPMNITVWTETKIELEKWDDRGRLPSDSDFSSISLDGVEAY